MYIHHYVHIYVYIYIHKCLSFYISFKLYIYHNIRIYIRSYMYISQRIDRYMNIVGSLHAGSVPSLKKRFWQVDCQRYMVNMVKRWHVWFVWRQETRKQRCKLNATVWEVKWWKWHNSWLKLGKTGSDRCESGIYKPSMTLLSTRRGEPTPSLGTQLVCILVMSLSWQYHVCTSVILDIHDMQMYEIHIYTYNYT